MNKKLYKCLMAILAIGLIICVCFVGKYYKYSMNSKDTFDELTTQKNIADDLSQMDSQYINEDMVGWIQIEGTTIDYPVMQTKDDPEYYLLRNYYKEDNNHGVPFADAQCEINPASDNIIIYGHHMQDKTMFYPLIEYTSKSFYDSHSIVNFNTIYSSDSEQYKIIAVFTSQVNLGTADEYPFYSYIDLKDEEEFQDFYNVIKNRSIYETGVTAELGDKFITLATCEYSKQSSRMVIIAVKIN